jgi:hypothetical protein
MMPEDVDSISSRPLKYPVTLISFISYLPIGEQRPARRFRTATKITNYGWAGLAAIPEGTK